MGGHAWIENTSTGDSSFIDVSLVKNYFMTVGEVREHRYSYHLVVLRRGKRLLSILFIEPMGRAGMQNTAAF